MSSSSSDTTCSGYFYDGGGQMGNYPVNQDVIVTFYPSTVGAKLSVTFTSFHTSDVLEVYNGDNTSPENKIGNLFGQAAYGTITSTAANGSLTFHFVSNDFIQGNESGWEATISCNPDPPIDITMIASGSFITCSGNFYDGGGPSGNYMTNQNTVVTLSPTPGSGAKISVTFNSFHTSDVLEVYNGDNTSPENKIGNLFGQSAYGTITSTAANGSLTFHFVSNDLIQGNESGWEATISCSPDPPINITMIASGSFTTCSGNFYDGGGPSGDYMTDQNTVVTLKPSTPGAKLSVSFTSFQTSSDVLTIFDGNSINATPIITLSGNINPGTFVSTANDGSLTFHFISDYLIQGSEVGWAATISCIGGSTNFSVNTSATQIPPWQRAEDDFSGHIDVNNPSNYLWHLEVDVHDVNGNYLFPIIYPSLNGLYQNFNTQTDPQLVAAAISGRQFKYYAVLDAGNQPFYASTQNIIEKKWENKNFVFNNISSQQLIIPLKYISGTTSISFSFERLSNRSSATNNIVSGTSILSNNNNEYIALSYSNSNLENVKPGVFIYQITYNGAGYSESSQFDLVKIKNIGNPASNSVVVLVGGSIDIEVAIRSLPINYSSNSTDCWSIAKDFVNSGKNTWYIATSNLNPLQKNAYNLGIALNVIKEICTNSGITDPKISVFAHSKGGLEMRMMMDGKGTPNETPEDFIPSPTNAFADPSIGGKLRTVIFLGTPHNDGVESGYVTGSFSENTSGTIAPVYFVNNQVNNPLIINYFINGTSTPNNIRIGNISAYRKCNKSDGAVSLTSSGSPSLIGPSMVNNFFVQDVGAPEIDPITAITAQSLCVTGCFVSVFFGNPDPLTCSGFCEFVPDILRYFYNVYWKSQFHHAFLTSSYVLGIL